MVTRRFLASFAIIVMAMVCAVPNISYTASNVLTLTQSPSSPPEHQLPSKRELEKLLKTLEDDQARQKLIDTIKALMVLKAEEPKGLYDQSLDFLELQAEGLQLSIHELEEQVENLPRWWKRFKKQLKTPDIKIEWLEVSWRILVILGAAFLAEALLRSLLRRISRKQDQETQGKRKYLIFKQWLFLFLPILLFLVVGHSLTFIFLPPSHVVQIIVLAFLYARTFVRVINDTAIFFWVWVIRQSKHKKTRDLEHILLTSLRRLVNFLVYGGFLYLALKTLKASSALMTLGVKLYILAMAILIIRFLLKLRYWQRTNYRFNKRVKESTKIIPFLFHPCAYYWFGITTSFILILTVAWLIDIPNGMFFVIQAVSLTLLVVMVVRAADYGVNVLLDYERVMNTPKVRQSPYLREKVKFYVLWPKRLLKVLIYSIGFFAILEIWAIDAFDFWETDFGIAILNSFSKIITVVIVSVIAWDLLNWWMLRFSRKPSRPNKARFKTLLPLFRNISLGFLVIVSGLTILSALGVNITPLLAGVGVLGLAIGFGAQTLVKDIISGIFFIAENAFAVNDWVQIGNLDGEVEALSMRSLRLRDIEGNVHTIPFSAVTTVTNYSREFGYAVVDVRVSYSENVDHVINILKEIGRRFFEEAEYREDLVEKPEVLGVQDMDEIGVLFRMRVKTKPSAQFAIQRELKRFIKNTFDKEDVAMPTWSEVRRQRTGDR